MNQVYPAVLVHLHSAWEVAALWEVAAAISTAMAMCREDGERPQRQAYAAPDAPLLVMLVWGQNSIPMHVQLCGRQLDPKRVCKLGQTSTLVQLHIYSYSPTQTNMTVLLAAWDVMWVDPGHRSSRP